MAIGVYGRIDSKGDCVDQSKFNQENQEFLETHARMTNRLHLEMLPREQNALCQLLAAQIWLKSFYLVGGTALSLQIGHRQSVDFDFFTRNDINNQ